MDKKKGRPKGAYEPPKNSSNFIIWLFIVLGIMWVFNAIGQNMEKPVQELTYSKFFEALKENPAGQIICPR